MDPLVNGVLLAAIPVAGTLLATRTTNRTEKEKAASADWSSYGQALEKRVDTLTARVDQMTLDMDGLRKELATAEDHGRGWRTHAMDLREVVKEVAPERMPVAPRIIAGDVE